MHPVPIFVRLFAGAVLLLLSCTSHARDLSVDDDDLIRVEIATLGLAAGGAPVVLLREPEGREMLPIFIGRAQAGAIARGMQGQATPRPLTHDLFGDVLARLDARLERIIVDDLDDNTFLGMLELERTETDELLRIDSRPSDAMALAVRTGASIYVTPRVMEAAATIEYRGMTGQPVTAAGITVTAATAQLREALDLPERDGLLVSEVVGPAADRGMTAGALLLAIDGEVPEAPMDFLERIQAQAPDGEVKIEYWQDGAEHTAEIPTDVPEPERGELPAPGEGFDL